MNYLIYQVATVIFNTRHCSWEEAVELAKQHIAEHSGGWRDL